MFPAKLRHNTCRERGLPFSAQDSASFNSWYKIRPLAKVLFINDSTGSPARATRKK